MCGAKKDGTSEEMPSRAAIVKATEPTDMSLEELEVYYGPDYAKGLYGQR